MRFARLAMTAAMCWPLVVPAQTPKEVGAETCRAEVPRALRLMDPDSAKVGAVRGGEMETMEYHGTPIAVRKYRVPVNSKNAYGAYTGETIVSCFTSEDGRRVLKVVE